LLVASTALALLGSMLFVSGVRADDVIIDTDVGGGAAGIVATLGVQSYDIAPLFRDNDIVEYTVSIPRVAMGRNGGNSTNKVTLVNQGALSVKAIVETVKGNRRGTPFAEASSTLTDVRFTRGALAGTALGTITSSCHWGRDNATVDNPYGTGVGSTTLIDVNGNKTQPAVNERHELGDSGYIVFNEQYTNDVFVTDENGYLIPDGHDYYIYSTTLYVIGAHIHLYEPLVLRDGSTTQDIQLGFSSCDPLKLPPLSGLSLSQSSYG
jgi:hypothetical protein